MIVKYNLLIILKLANIVNHIVVTVIFNFFLLIFFIIIACKRGSPEYKSKPHQNDDELINNCQTANVCGNNFECALVGSAQLCCPTISHICSNHGGRYYPLPRLTNYDPGVVVKKTYHQNYPSTYRYYYDVEQGRCMPFTYLGAFGNFNNFKTTSECEMFCAKLQCNYGSPLKIGSNNQRCNSNVDCPSTHECQSDHNVCCPRPRKLISQVL